MDSIRFLIKSFGAKHETFLAALMGSLANNIFTLVFIMRGNPSKNMHHPHIVLATAYKNRSSQKSIYSPVGQLTECASRLNLKYTGLSNMAKNTVDTVTHKDNPPCLYCLLSQYPGINKLISSSRCGFVITHHLLVASFSFSPVFG